MKKNRMMRSASALLVMVLLTTSVISGTFAKYVTKATSEDTARVAHWGVQFTTTSDDLFKTQYEQETTNHTGTYSVKSTTALVAPGTEGDAYTFTTKGTPEVSYQVTFNADETTMKTVFLTKDLAGATLSDTYYPVEFKVTIGTTDVTPATQDVTGIVDAIEGCSYY